MNVDLNFKQAADEVVLDGYHVRTAKGNTYEGKLDFGMISFEPDEFGRMPSISLDFAGLATEHSTWQVGCSTGSSMDSLALDVFGQQLAAILPLIDELNKDWAHDGLFDR